MHLTRLLLLLPFSATSTLATPVADDPNLLSGSTHFPNSLDIDLSQDSTNQPPPEVSSSKSALQLVATSHDPKDLPSQDYSKASIDLPYKSAGDVSNTPPANLFSKKPAPFPPPDDLWPFGNYPDCKGWTPLCCFGHIYVDDEGYMSIDSCFPCNDLFLLSFPFSLLWSSFFFCGNSATVGGALTKVYLRRCPMVMPASGDYILLLFLRCRLHFQSVPTYVRKTKNLAWLLNLIRFLFFVIFLFLEQIAALTDSCVRPRDWRERTVTTPSYPRVSL